MPTIIRRTGPSVVEVQQGLLQSISWQVRSGTWSPPTDVYETDDQIVVRVEIAGMKDEDFEVVHENNILLISGVRTEKSEKRAYHQMEIRFGKFKVAIGLASQVDVDGSRAEYADGFLTVILPKIKSEEQG